MKLPISSLPLWGFFVLPLVFTSTGCNGQTTEQANTEITNTATYQDIDLASFEEMRTAGDAEVVLLDVRTPAETAAGMIPGALHLDYRAADFAEQIAQLDRDKTYLVYCKSGGRSARASELMNELNFGKVHNLTVGYDGWSAAQ